MVAPDSDGANADDGFGRRAFQQSSAHIAGAEAVLQVHGRAHAVDLPAQEVAGEDAFKQALVVAAL